jgi:opacity protein-like surface antigen
LFERVNPSSELPTIGGMVYGCRVKRALALTVLALGFMRAESAAAATDDDDDAPAATAPADADKSGPVKPNADKPEAKPNDEAKDKNFGHGFQFGLRAGLVGGYNMLFRYNQSPLCAVPDPNKAPKDQQKFCGHAAPLALDFGLSFALLDFFEPYVWARLGLTGEAETDTKPLQVYGVGARLYTMSDSAFKIFIDPALAYEVEGGQGHPGWGAVPGAAFTPQYKKDIVFHLAAGPELDLAKEFGVYVDAGLTTGILRSIHTTLELQGGVQFRAP